jgi:hypothetical protein
MRTLILFTALAVTAGTSAKAQEAGKPTPDQVVDKQKTAGKTPGATYGKIKEVKAGQKIVIAIDGAPDKSYDLGDAKRSIQLAEDLAVGDPVKIMETDKKGAKSVQIVRDVRNDATRARTDSSGGK